MLLPYFRDADTTSLNLTNRFATKLNISDTSSMLTNYRSALNTKLNITDTTLMLSKYLRKLDTITLSNRINLKVNISDTASMLTPYFRDSDTTSLNLTSRFSAKQNILNGTGFVKASGINITYDNSSYLRTGLADSSYLKLTGGTLSGTLNGTKLNLNSGIDVSGDFATPNHLNVSALFRGYQVLVAPNNDYGQTRIHFPNRPVTEGFSEFGSGVRHKFDGSDARNSFLSLYTSSSSSLQIDAVSINSLGNVGINDTTPSFKLDVNGTLGVTGAATLSSTLAVQGDITENGNNVLTSADTTDMLAPYIERGDTATMLNPYWRSGKFSGTLPIANGGTGAESASVARTTLAVGYIFSEVTAGTLVLLTSNRVSIVNTGGSSTTQLDLTPATNGRMYMIKNLASGTVISDASNVIPFNGGSPGTAILGAGNVTPQWCTLVADGTNWHVMQRN
jgi:hypothetical protein